MFLSRRAATRLGVLHVAEVFSLRAFNIYVFRCERPELGGVFTLLTFQSYAKEDGGLPNEAPGRHTRDERSTGGAPRLFANCRFHCLSSEDIRARSLIVRIADAIS